MLRIISATLLIASAAHAETLPIPGHPAVVVHGPTAIAKQVVETELAFAGRAAEAGPGPAMSEFMDATDGLAFLGGEPIRGAAAIGRAHGGPNGGGTLSWYPVEVFAGTDMATVWGRFSFTPPGGAGKTVTGRYVTVWRKSGDSWKGIVDIGNPD
jgi:hypothetical protein